MSKITNREVLAKYAHARHVRDAIYPETQEAQDELDKWEAECQTRGINPNAPACQHCHWWRGYTDPDPIIQRHVQPVNVDWLVNLSAFGYCRQRGPFATGFPITREDDYCPKFELPRLP